MDLELCKVHRLMLTVYHASMYIYAHMYEPDVCTHYKYGQHTCLRMALVQWI